MKKLIFLSIFIFISVSASAFEGDPQTQVNLFFKSFKNASSSEAIDNLFSNNELVAQKAQKLTMLKQQLLMLPSLFGKYQGHENIYSEELSPSLVRIVEIAKYEFHPVICEFYFYKPKDKWITSQAMFVDQFQLVDSKK